MNGTVNFHKQQGMTSHDAVGFMRRLTGIRRIGHTGTLDPMATGVLPICIGKSTRLIEYMNDDKRYSAVMKLGLESDTLDIWGSELIPVPIVKKPTYGDIEICIKSFEGHITQRVPGFSAQKHNGKKLYEYARAGKEVPVKSKEVDIYSIKMIDYDTSNMEIKLDIYCSRGTYVRMICSDIGRKLGTAAVMSKLIRTEAGILKLEDSVTMKELEDENNRCGNIDRYLKATDTLLKPEKICILPEQADRFADGLTIDIPVREKKVYAVYDSEFVGIGIGSANGLKPHKIIREK